MDSPNIGNPNTLHNTQEHLASITIPFLLQHGLSPSNHCLPRHRIPKKPHTELSTIHDHTQAPRSRAYQNARTHENTKMNDAKNSSLKRDQHLTRSPSGKDSKSLLQTRMSPEPNKYSAPTRYHPIQSSHSISPSITSPTHNIILNNSTHHRTLSQ